MSRHVAFPWLPLFFHFRFKGKWTVPLPKVRTVGEDEVFKVMRTGKRRSECLPLPMEPLTHTYTHPTPHLPREGMEEDGYQGNIRWRRIHQETA